ncbi:uncharacterized protein LOC111675877 [Lucilia cuprina]|uniref:uncharacterized protein LOC111675877 n=1 Tax=Lucilia cuprina TaxID=7375 RepID=UPI001F06F9F4|nr:uncharacterized protein LOC111675877 [Lucilia cuprina]
MRKYQQLLLLLISVISVGVLFMYKTENNRLKDVLHVINFFGRNDAAILKRIENNATMNYLIDYLHPLAVWQSIGDNFHGYSAHWKRNELVAGGEAVVLVVGRKGVVLNFKCSLSFKGSSSNIQGKFRFQRLDKDGDDDNSDFTRYNFYCRVTRDFGLPETVTFNDLTSSSKNGHSLRLRHVKVIDELSKKLATHPLTVCVDLVSPEFQNMTVIDKQGPELLEFFIHHFALGIEDFIIYNGDSLPQNLLPLLNRFNIRIHLLPFNFPYTMQNASERIRGLIESDCLLRSTNRARHCLLLAPNEFFYPNTKLDHQKSIVRALNHYSNEVSRFDLPVFAVCKSEKYKYLFENNLYDPELRPLHTISIYRPQDTGIALSAEDLSNTPRRIALPLSQVFTHRYVNCLHVGKDGLHDWRNSLREDFMQHIQRLNQEIKILI